MCSIDNLLFSRSVSSIPLGDFMLQWIAAVLWFILGLLNYFNGSNVNIVSSTLLKYFVTWFIIKIIDTYCLLAFVAIYAFCNIIKLKQNVF